MKVLMKIILAFSSFIFLISLFLTVSAVEEKVTEQKKDPHKLIKFTDYKALKGAELIRMVQLVLKDSGFDPGPIDSLLGPRTRTAIKNFQVQKGLKPTGALDRHTLDRLFWSF